MIANIDARPYGCMLKGNGKKPSLIDARPYGCMLKGQWRDSGGRAVQIAGAFQTREVVQTAFYSESHRSYVKLHGSTRNDME